METSANSCCRLCLKKTATDPYSSLLKLKKLSEWVEIHMKIKVNANDGLPTRVCEECLRLIRNYSQYVAAVQRKQDILLKENIQNNSKKKTNATNGAAVLPKKAKTESTSPVKINDSEENSGDEPNANDNNKETEQTIEKRKTPRKMNDPDFPNNQSLRVGAGLDQNRWSSILAAEPTISIQTEEPDVEDADDIGADDNGAVDEEAGDEPNVIKTEEPDVADADDIGADDNGAVDEEADDEEAGDEPNVIKTEEPDVIKTEEPDVIKTEETDVIKTEEPAVIKTDEPDVEEANDEDDDDEQQQALDGQVLDIKFTI